MVSAENRVIAAGFLGVIIGFILLAAVETFVGLPGQWGFVVAFLLLALLGVVIPQVYLSSVDRSVSRTARMGVVTVVLLVLASGFSAEVSGTEGITIWILVGISFALIVAVEIRDGYRQSVQDGTSEP
ncbi:hypothetical protein [Halorubrum vacuolatum]|uniref:Uncharacterized protein n=1 Tax=Halorubrum vacuolatum TaxID=63740 RepID=A0A238WLQ5_HALVU|nr:hypothetical protein [Halorubrum vacuolatum]SNR47506.1 hypothetical protein SAMN06264855_108137 [Halorubrum vacuolatum]